MATPYIALEAWPAEASPRPTLEVIEGGGATTPPIGHLALVSTTSREDCMLTDIDDLGRFVSSDGSSYEPQAVVSVRQNKVTGVKENAIPYARSRVEHGWEPSPNGRGGVIRDLGRTAVEIAMGGYKFYQYPETLACADADVASAKHNQESLRPGIVQVMIAPKLTRKDASLKVAQADGLAETDSIQLNWLERNKADELKAMTEAILAADVPISAWAAMLEDPGNIFGKSVPVSDPESAYPVMWAFPGLELTPEQLPEGPVSILAAVLPYITDPVARQKVSGHLRKFRGDQVALHERAIGPAERWLNFDMAIEQSLRAGAANPAVQEFIESLEGRWADEDEKIINLHKIVSGGRSRYTMSRKLAVIVENAQRNLIFTAAAVASGNTKVLAQMNPRVAEQIYQAEMAISAAQAAGSHIGRVALMNNSLIAAQNIRVGGGCLGENQARFKTDLEAQLGFDVNEAQRSDDSSPSSQELSWHGGRITRGTCVNCREVRDVGVKSWCQECISGHCGSRSVPHKPRLQQSQQPVKKSPSRRRLSAGGKLKKLEKAA